MKVEKEVSRDRVTFKIGREDNVVSITTHATHLKVFVQSETEPQLLYCRPHLMRFVTLSDSVLMKA